MTATAPTSDAPRGRLPPATTYMLLGPLILLLAFGLLWPLGSLLIKSIFSPDPTLAHYERIAVEPLYIRTIGTTIQTSILVTVLALLLGYPFAVVMARAGKRYLLLLTVCLIISLWTSVLVRSYAWILLFQRTGVINNVLLWSGIVDAPVKLLYTKFAIVVSMTHILLPFMILPIFTALRSIPRDLDRAARNLGAGPFASFFHVVFPLSLPGVYAGTIMVFILATGFYITPALVGGPDNLTIATLIAQNTTLTLDWPFAAALSGTLLIVTLLFVFAFRRFININAGGK
jgi:mannopine transport system permease protein